MNGSWLAFGVCAASIVVWIGVSWICDNGGGPRTRLSWVAGLLAVGIFAYTGQPWYAQGAIAYCCLGSIYNSVYPEGNSDAWGKEDSTS